MKPDERLLSDVIQPILKVSKPKKMILFGSGAEDGMTRDSNIDLLVLEQSLRNEKKETIPSSSVLTVRVVPVDIFAMTVERFKETKNVIGGLAYPANKSGRVI